MNVSIDPPSHSLPGCSASSCGNSSPVAQRFMSLSINLVLFRSSCPGLLPTPVPCVQINSASSLCPPPPLIFPANHGSATWLQSITLYKSQPTLSFCNKLKTKPWLQDRHKDFFFFSYIVDAFLNLESEAGYLPLPVPKKEQYIHQRQDPYHLIAWLHEKKS